MAKFDEIRALFDKNKKYKLPTHTHFSTDALQIVWHSQIELEPMDYMNRVLIKSNEGKQLDGCTY